MIYLPPVHEQPGVCDGCNKSRHTTYRVAVNPYDGVVEFAACFFCIKEGRKEQERLLYEEAAREAARR